MALIPYHEVRDAEHLRALIDSIAANGWQGAPLVVMDRVNLMTGSHRYAATQALGWDDDDVPTIELADIFADAGLDLDATMAIEDCDGVDSANLAHVTNALPAAVREQYGIDIN